MQLEPQSSGISAFVCMCVCVCVCVMVKLTRLLQGVGLLDCNCLLCLVLFSLCCVLRLEGVVSITPSVQYLVY